MRARRLKRAKKPKPKATLSLAAKKYRESRRRNLGIAIDLAWISLRTHLADAVKTNVHANSGNERWHAQCVNEYAQMIYTGSIELLELTKIDFAEKFSPVNRPL